MGRATKAINMSSELKPYPRALSRLRSTKITFLISVPFSVICLPLNSGHGAIGSVDIRLK